MTACIFIFTFNPVYTDGDPGFVQAVFVCLTIWLLALLLCSTLVCWLQISNAVIYVQHVWCHLFLALFWCLSHLLYDAFMPLIYVAMKYWLHGEIWRCFYHTVQKEACHDHIFLLILHLKPAEGMKIWLLDGFEEEHLSLIRESTVGLKSCFEFPECDLCNFGWVSFPGYQHSTSPSAHLLLLITCIMNGCIGFVQSVSFYATWLPMLIYSNVCFYFTCLFTAVVHRQYICWLYILSICFSYSCFGCCWICILMLSCCQCIYWWIVVFECYIIILWVLSLVGLLCVLSGHLSVSL